MGGRAFAAVAHVGITVGRAWVAGAHGARSCDTRSNGVAADACLPAGAAVRDVSLEVTAGPAAVPHTDAARELAGARGAHATGGAGAAAPAAVCDAGVRVYTGSATDDLVSGTAADIRGRCVSQHRNIRWRRHVEESGRSSDVSASATTNASMATTSSLPASEEICGPSRRLPHPHPPMMMAMNPVARDSLMIAPVPFQNRPAHCRPSVPGPTMQPIRARTSAPRRGEGAVARRTTEVTASAPPATRPIVESSSMDSTRSTSD